MSLFLRPWKQTGHMKEGAWEIKMATCFIYLMLSAVALAPQRERRGQNRSRLVHSTVTTIAILFYAVDRFYPLCEKGGIESKLL